MNVSQFKKPGFIIATGVVIFLVTGALIMLLNQQKTQQNPRLPAQVGQISNLSGSTETTTSTESSTDTNTSLFRGSAGETNGGTFDPTGGGGGEIGTGTTGDGEPQPIPPPPEQPSDTPSNPDPAPEPEPTPEPDPGLTPDLDLAANVGEVGCDTRFGGPCDLSNNNPAVDPEPNPDPNWNPDGSPQSGSFQANDNGDNPGTCNPATGENCDNTNEPTCGTPGKPACPEQPDPECGTRGEPGCPDEQPKCSDAFGNPVDCPKPCDPAQGNCGSTGSLCDPATDPNCNNNVGCFGPNCDPKNIDFCDPNTDPECKNNVDFCDPQKEICPGYIPPCLGDNCNNTQQQPVCDPATQDCPGEEKEPPVVKNPPSSSTPSSTSTPTQKPTLRPAAPTPNQVHPPKLDNSGPGTLGLMLLAPAVTYLAYYRRRK